MSARIVALILVASLTPGGAFAKKAERKLIQEDRYLYAQPDAAPTPAPRMTVQPPFQPDQRDPNNANGS